MKAIRRKPGRPKKSRKNPALEREAIVKAAFKELERAGLQAFSLRGLAARLHCQPMSLYHYFESKQHLFDAMVDERVSRIAMPGPGLGWDERLRKLSREWRRVALEESAFFPVFATHRMNTPRAMQLLENVLAIFNEGGFDPETSARCFRVMGYYLTGAALDETGGYGAGPSAAEPVSDEDESRDFPNVARAGEYFAPEHYEKTFELGLEMLLERFSAIRLARSTKTMDRK